MGMSPVGPPARTDSLASLLARQDSIAALLRQDSWGVRWEGFRDGGTATLGRQESLAALLGQSSLGKLFRQVGGSRVKVPAGGPRHEIKMFEAEDSSSKHGALRIQHLE